MTSKRNCNCVTMMLLFVNSCYTIQQQQQQLDKLWASESFYLCVTCGWRVVHCISIYHVLNAASDQDYYFVISSVITSFSGNAITLSIARLFVVAHTESSECPWAAPCSVDCVAECGVWAFVCMYVGVCVCMCGLYGHALWPTITTTTTTNTETCWQVSPSLISLIIGRDVWL